MAIIVPTSVISEGKLAAVIIFTLIAGMVIGVFIGFLIWKAHIIQLPIGLLEQAHASFPSSMTCSLT
jgi:tetrahydromethanopterin S-methyltransferase subunit C